MEELMYPKIGLVGKGMLQVQITFEEHTEYMNLTLTEANYLIHELQHWVEQERERRYGGKSEQVMFLK